VRLRVRLAAPQLREPCALCFGEDRHAVYILPLSREEAVIQHVPSVVDHSEPRCATRPGHNPSASRRARQ
jgi:hypothetical protein